MDLHADTVPEAVAESLAVAGGIDDLAGDRVHRPPLGAGLDRVERGPLGGPHQLVDLSRRPADLTRGEGTGAI